MPSEEFSSTSAKVCADRLRRDGYTLVDGVLSEDIVANLNEEFNRRYAHLKLPGARFDDSAQTGDRRYMLTVELSGAFGDFSVYANPFIMDILNIVFDKTFVLDSFGVVLSLPGAKTQHLHRDGQLLFSNEMASILPAWAVTVGIPLTDMNMEQGTTEVFPGSHRLTHWKESSSSVVPNVPAGSGIMWDYRTLHRGTENHSARYRPLLYLTYSRSWWRDSDNFKPTWDDSGPVRRQGKVLVGQDFFRSVPRESRFLFSNHV